MIKAKLKAARDAISKKDFPAARSAASDVLSYEPNNYNALVFSGIALLELGETSQSEEAYQKAAQLVPDQTLAWQGLLKLYERTKERSKCINTLRSLLDLFTKSADTVKSAETIQKIIEIQREHGTRMELVDALSLLLPSSPSYSVISALPAPDMTNPEATKTFTTQVAIHNSLSLLEEIIGLVQREEDSIMSKEVERRRMRLNAGKPEDIKREVGRDIYASSQLPTLYAEVLNHPNTSDELRRATESKLLRYQLSHLHAAPAESELKERLRAEVEEMARGAVLLGVEDELAWTINLDALDGPIIDDRNLNMFRRFIHRFETNPIARVITGYLHCRGIPSWSDEDDENDEKDKAELFDYEDALQIAIDGFNGAQSSILAHRIMAELYIGDRDLPNTITLCEAGLRLLNLYEPMWGSKLPLTRAAFNASLATALVHHFPPKHHARALGILDSVLTLYPKHVDCLMARGYILQAANKLDAARDTFSQAVRLTATASDDAGMASNLEAKEEVAWCSALMGEYESAGKALRVVISLLESSDGLEERKAKAWWRLGRTLWDQGGDARAQAYPTFITALKQLPTFAPAFTSLGIFYLDLASPPDPVRASKCFQKAVELDAREGEAARRLAEGFADEREWDLVEVVARRTIEGEGGAEGDIASSLASGNVVAASRYKPVNAWAWKAIGVVELNRANFGPAIVGLQIALRGDKSDFRTWTRLGEAYAKSGRPVAALKALFHARELSPSDDWTCTFFIGDVYRQTGQYELANSMFEEILQTRPDDVGVLLALADSHLALGRIQSLSGFVVRAESSFGESIKISLRVIERSQHGFRRLAWKNIADALYELSHISLYAIPSTLQPLVSMVSQLINADIGSLEPIEGFQQRHKNMAARLQDSTFDGPTILSLALEAYQYRHTLVQSAEDEVKAAALFDVSVALYKVSSQEQTSEGSRAISNHATDLLKRALRQDPSNEVYWNALGSINFHHEPQLAQHAFIKALELDHKNAAIWTNLGLLYLHHNDAELANETLYRAQTLDPEYSLAWVGQALVATSNGHLPESKALLEHALGLTVPIPQAEYEYADRVFRQFANHDGASKPSSEQLLTPYFALGRYCGQLSQDPSGLHLFALVCERLGQKDLAIELLVQAIGFLESAYDKTEDETTEMQYAIANVNLGRLRLAVGDHASAIDAFDVVVGLLSGAEAPTSALVCVQARFGQGLAHFKLGDLESALSAFETALADTPEEFKDVKGHVAILLAQTLWAIGGNEAQEAAKSQLLECIGEDPENLIAITTLAAMGIVSQNDELLTAALSEVINVSPERRQELDPTGQVDQLLTLHNLDQGDTDAALTRLEAIVHANPTLERARIDLVVHLAQASMYEAAQTVLSERPDVLGLDARTTLHERLRLSAIVGTHVASDDSSDIVRKDAQRAVLLAPWNKQTWDGLAYVRSKLADS